MKMPTPSSATGSPVRTLSAFPPQTAAPTMTRSDMKPLPTTAPPPTATTFLSRRAVASLFTSISAAVTQHPLLPLLPALADEAKDPFNSRPRNMGKYQLIPGDYYYIFGQVPPRSITAPNTQQPQWNAFGSCVENSCTYVPIQQRYNAYTKYERRLSRGIDAYRAIGLAVAKQDWPAVLSMTYRGGDVIKPSPGQECAGECVAKIAPPAPAVDALLKAGLLASQMLVSPNNLREKKEAALATFYVNEVSYALECLEAAAASQDLPAATAAWEFGKDSWNSYLAVINPAVVPKVGDKFALVE